MKTTIHDIRYNENDLPEYCTKITKKSRLEAFKQSKEFKEAFGLTHGKGKRKNKRKGKKK